MEIGVGIPTYDRSDPLKRCLVSLAQQDHPIDHLVIGDQNPDDTAIAVVDDITSKYPTEWTVTILDRPEVETTPGTRNEILEAVNEDVICYLDDDTELPSQWSEAILDGYSHSSDPVAVGGPVPSVTPAGEYVAEFIRTSENQNKLNKYGEHEGKSGRWLPPHPVQTDLLPGGNMSFRTSALWEVGGFDSGYGLNPVGEEFEPQYALKQRGESFIYHPDARVKHYDTDYGGQEEYFSYDADYYYWEARHLIRAKWNHFHDVFWVALLRLLLYTEYKPPAAAWKIVGTSILRRDLTLLYWIAGYIDGLRYEIDII